MHVCGGGGGLIGVQCSTELPSLVLAFFKLAVVNGIITK